MLSNTCYRLYIYRSYLCITTIIYYCIILTALTTTTHAKDLPPGYGKVSFSTPLKSMTLPPPVTPQKYQFVGVPTSPGKPCKWYARKAPKGQKKRDVFKLRMIHLDKKSLIRDMLLRRDVDLYVTYKNTGKVDGSTGKVSRRVSTPVF